MTRSVAGRGQGLAECARRLRAGELAVHPAETVYGFGGTLDPRPLEALRALKGRSSGGFVVLIPDPKSVEPLLGDAGRALARAFWPGPLTLVVEDLADRFPPAAKAPDGTVALRAPGREDTLALLREVGGPMTSTSANAPGGRPAVTVTEALAAAGALGRSMAALDGGRLPGGRPSTMVRAAPGPPVLLRRGQVGERDLARALGGEIGVACEASRRPARAPAKPVELGGVVREDDRGDEQRACAREHGQRGPASAEPAPFVITFVCSGNTCRSPMAEAVARKAIARARIAGVQVRSAGVAAHPGSPASEGARRIADEAGLDLACHRSTLLTRELTRSSSLVLCMGRNHADRVEALGGGDRCRLLKAMAGEMDRAGGAGSTGGDRMDEVADAFGGDDDAYRETFLELERAVEKIVNGLARDLG